MTENKLKLKPEQPIGVFDSGIGGLNVVKVMQQYLPHEKIIYYGDTAHTPWGNQSSKTINKYSLNITKYLLEQNCKTIIIACNTASCVAYENITKLCAPYNISVFNVAEPLLDHIKNNININNPKLAIIGTTRTIQSKIYQNNLQVHWPQAVITAMATPVLCPIIEEKMHLQNNIINNILKFYLAKPEFKNLDGLILACTHYHSLKEAINKFYKNKILLLEGSDFLAQSVKKYLEKNNLLNKTNTKKFELSCFFSSQPKDPIESYNYK